VLKAARAESNRKARAAQEDAKEVTYKVIKTGSGPWASWKNVTEKARAPRALPTPHAQLPGGREGGREGRKEGGNAPGCRIARKARSRRVGELRSRRHSRRAQVAGGLSREDMLDKRSMMKADRFCK
jgi:hypothetical protein